MHRIQRKNLPVLLCIVISVLQLQVFGKVKNAVVFGEHANKVKTLEQHTFRIFVDMNGDFYPEDRISNEELKTAGQSQLVIWAKKYPGKFQKVANSYRLKNTSFSRSNFLTLQDSIRQSIVRTINQLGKVRQTWIIHGFRKKLTRENIDNLTSTFENRICRNRINGYLKLDSNHLTIEVYWDGKYMHAGGVKQTLKLGFLFKNKSIPNAQKCGYALRALFSGITCQKINLISHSAGVHVVTSLLFNVKRNYTLPTPIQADIRVAITASASSGKKHFKRYYQRNSSIDYRANDNYTLFNLMNENDLVLLKKLGRLHFTKLLGNTALGCNHKGESNKLKGYFKKKYIHSTFKEGYVKNSRDHWFKGYIVSNGFDEVLKFLYD